MVFSCCGWSDRFLTVVAGGIKDEAWTDRVTDSALRPAANPKGLHQQQTVFTGFYLKPFRPSLLHLQEHAAAIHRQKQGEHDGEIAKREPRLVEVAQKRRKPVTHRLHRAAEIHHLAYHVGRDGVHAIYLEPIQPSAVPFHVYPPVEEPHQQEAQAAREERHAACPYSLDDWHFQAPQQACCHQRHAYGKEEQRSFCKKFAGELNKWLSKQGIYTYLILPGEHLTEQNIEYMDVIYKPVKEEAKNRLIEYVEQLPYIINYVDDFDEKQKMVIEGRMIVNRWEN